jgi:hypothetical protein
MVQDSSGRLSARCEILAEDIALRLFKGAAIVASVAGSIGVSDNGSKFSSNSNALVRSLVCDSKMPQRNH